MAKLTRDELKRLKALAQRGDYSAIVALLDFRVAQELEKLVNCTDDHRYTQGKLKALSELRDDIVTKDENF